MQGKLWKKNQTIIFLTDYSVAVLSVSYILYL